MKRQADPLGKTEKRGKLKPITTFFKGCQKVCVMAGLMARKNIRSGMICETSRTTKADNVLRAREKPLQGNRETSGGSGVGRLHRKLGIRPMS